jgi:hypothetical protein
MLRDGRESRPRHQKRKFPATDRVAACDTKAEVHNLSASVGNAVGLPEPPSKHLAPFRHSRPLLLAVAIDMHFGIEPAGIVERSSLDERDARHCRGIREDGRAALWTEVSVNRLTTFAGVMKSL